MTSADRAPRLAVLLAKIDSLIRKDDAAAATAVAGSAAEQFPGNPFVDLRLAELALRAGDTEAALRYAIASGQSAPHTTAVVVPCADILLRSDRSLDALLQLSRLPVNGETAEALVAAAIALKHSDIPAHDAPRLRDAINDLETALIGADDKEGWTVATLAADIADKVHLYETAARLRVRGHVDFAPPLDVFGWVVDTKDPERKYELEVLSSAGVVIAKGIADRHHDLNGVGIAGKAHGYRIRLDYSSTLDSELVSVREIRTGAILGATALPEFATALDSSSLDSDKTHVTGWCIQRKRTRLRPRLLGVAGDRQFPIGVASLFRPDLVRKDLGDGFNGFEFDKRKLQGVERFAIIEARSASVLLQGALALPEPEVKAPVEEQDPTNAEPEHQAQELGASPAGEGLE